MMRTSHSLVASSLTELNVSLVSPVCPRLHVALLYASAGNMTSLHSSPTESLYASASSMASLPSSPLASPYASAGNCTPVPVYDSRPS